MGAKRFQTSIKLRRYQEFFLSFPVKNFILATIMDKIVWQEVFCFLIFPNIVLSLIYPTSWFSFQSLSRNMFICANNFDIGERGVI